MIVLAIGFLSAVGCSTAPQPRSEPPVKGTHARKKLSKDAVTLRVPAVYQTEKFECGLTSLTMLFAYYGHEVDQKETVWFRKKAKEEQGIAAEDLKKYLTSQGFDAYIFKGTTSHSPPTGIYGHIDKGRPVVVVIPSSRTSRHYVLVIGYDKKKKLIALQDPVRGAVLASERQFHILWKSCGNFALLAVPKGDEKNE